MGHDIRSLLSAQIWNWFCWGGEKTSPKNRICEVTCWSYYEAYSGTEKYPVTPCATQEPTHKNKGEILYFHFCMQRPCKQGNATNLYKQNCISPWLDQNTRTLRHIKCISNAKSYADMRAIKQVYLDVFCWRNKQVIKKTSPGVYVYHCVRSHQACLDPVSILQPEKYGS